MSAPKFEPPPVGKHTHVVAKSRLQAPYCSGCGYRLGFLLDTQPVVEIVQPRAASRWTSWKEPRLDDIGRA